MVIDQVVYFSKAALGDLSQLTHYQLISVAYGAKNSSMGADPSSAGRCIVRAVGGARASRCCVCSRQTRSKTGGTESGGGNEKLVSVDKLVDAGKAVVKAIVVIWAVFGVVRLITGVFSSGQVKQRVSGALTLAQHLANIRMVLFVFLFISLFDVLYQKIQLHKESENEPERHQAGTEGAKW